MEHKELFTLDEQKLLDSLAIRFADLRFVIAFRRACTLPKNKPSALRGGMGQMMLGQCCVRDRNCAACDFEQECLVRRMMYAKFEIQPGFAGSGDSMGYVIECENQAEQFAAGERLQFRLLLFGKTIVHFSQFLQAFYMLGQHGIGRDKAPFDILWVMNQEGRKVVDGNRVCLQKLGISLIRDYALERRREILEEGCENTVVFPTPVTLKYQGAFLQEFQEEALFRSILRRIYSFNCFEGQEVPLYSMDDQLPVLLQQEARLVAARRYSSTSNGKMELRGISGKMVFRELTDLQLLVLTAGEKLHIGKNTSFGFGRYKVF